MSILPRTILLLVAALLTTSSTSRLLAEQAQSQEAVSVQGLIEQLKSSDEAQREQAASRLGEIGSSAVEAVPALMELLNEKTMAYWRLPGPTAFSPAGAAALALARIGDKRAIQPILKRVYVVRVSGGVGPPPGTDYFNGCLLSALGMFKDPSIVPALVHMSGESNWSPFTTDLAQLALRGIGEPAVRFLLSQLSSGSEENSSEAAFILLRVLKDHDDFIELVLGGMKNALAGDKDYVRENALAIAEYDRRFRHPSLFTSFVGLLASTRAGVRSAAAAACGVPGNSDAVEPLIRLYKSDDDHFAKGDALGALGEIEDPRAIDVLIDALRKDENYNLRSTAARSLGAFIAAPRAFDALVASLKDDTEPYVRNAAAQTLGKSASPEAFEPLCAALKDKEVTSTATWALGALGDKRALPLLIDLLENPNSRVREDAKWALKNMTGQDFGQDARSWREWSKKSEKTPDASPPTGTTVRYTNTLKTRWQGREYVARVATVTLQTDPGFSMPFLETEPGGEYAGSATELASLFRELVVEESARQSDNRMPFLAKIVPLDRTTFLATAGSSGMHIALGTIDASTTLGGGLVYDLKAGRGEVVFSKGILAVADETYNLDEGARIFAREGTLVGSGISKAGADSRDKVGDSPYLRRVLPFQRPNVRRPLQAGPADGDAAQDVLQLAQLGMSVQRLTQALADDFGYDGVEGLVVNEVMAKSLSEQIGFRVGDIIVSVDDKAVPPDDKLGEMLTPSAGRRKRFSVWRNGLSVQLEYAQGEKTGGS